jgi:hypothetical protein
MAALLPIIFNSLKFLQKEGLKINAFGERVL